MPQDFHFINPPLVTCPGESISFFVNNIGADRYYWLVPASLGSQTLDEQFVTGIQIQGTWIYTIRTASVFGQYRYAINNRSDNRIIYRPLLPYEGLYRVYLSYFAQSANKNNVPVTVNSLSGASRYTLNQRSEPGSDGWQLIGTFPFAAGNTSTVTISTDGTSNEIVIADAARFELVSFADDTSITLKAQKGKKDVICVEAQFFECQKSIRICSDSFGSELSTPEIIQEENSVCPGVSYTFKVKENGANAFVWHLPPGMSIQGKTGSVRVTSAETTIRMDSIINHPVKAGVTSYLESCNTVSDTGYTKEIIFNGIDCPLPDAEFINNSFEICEDGTLPISIKRIKHADEYEWELPPGIQTTDTKETGIIRTTEPIIFVEPNGLFTGTTGKVKVKALSSFIRPGRQTESLSEIRVVPKISFNTAFIHPSACETMNGMIIIGQMEREKAYQLSYYYAEKKIEENIITDKEGQFVISKLETGRYDSIKIVTGACSFMQKEPVFLEGPDTSEIYNIVIGNEEKCGDLGIIRILLKNADQNSMYEIDLNNDGQYEENKNSENGQLVINNLKAGTLINNLSIRNSSNGCKSKTDFSGEITKLPISGAVVQCVDNFQAIIKWNQNDPAYYFTNDDRKIIPKIPDSCLLYRTKVNFATQPEEWKNADFLNYHSIIPTDSSHIYWQLTDDEGNLFSCKTRIIFKLEQVAPSAFSPNNDGVNDTWQIDFLRDYPDCQVSVFNRLGLKVFESRRGYIQDWDGKLRGVLVPVDTYYYVITLNKGGDVIKGNLSVIY